MSGPPPDSGVSWLRPGEAVCGRYEVSRYLGSGSTGHVVTARHIELSATVALKFLHPEYATDAGATVRFFRAARRNLALTSSHIARVYDVDLHAGAPLFVTEALGNCHLRAVLAQQEPLPRASAVDYALQVCEALAAAHALSIVHGNLKPENIFVLGSQTIKVVDFGVSARALGLDDCESREPLTRASHVRLDAPLYLAPEQVRKTAAQDTRSDIWSLGCVLYELLSGKPPFGRGGLIRTCVAILEQDPAPLSVPDALWRVLERCLQKNPCARFTDVAELADALVPYGTGRYSHYAAQCRARLRTSHELRHEPEARSVVRYRAISVTSDGARAGIVRASRVKRGASPIQAVSVARTFALGATADADHSAGRVTADLHIAAPPQEHPPERAAESVMRKRPRALALGLLCLVGLGVLGVLSSTHEPAQKPRLLHLVKPRASATAPEDELAPDSTGLLPDGIAAAPPLAMPAHEASPRNHGGRQ